jgi:peptidylprolyl isomerase
MAEIRDPENTVIIELKDGPVVIELLPDVAPQHVERIKTLARQGAYDNVAFHRVIEGFMAQTGDVENGNMEAGSFNIRRAGTGGSELPDVPAEFSNIPHDRGTIGAARSSNPNSANSQFFINFKDNHFLNRPVHGLWPRRLGHGARGQDHEGRAPLQPRPHDPRPGRGRRPTRRPSMSRLAILFALAAGPPFATGLEIDVAGEANGTIGSTSSRTWRRSMSRGSWNSPRATSTTTWCSTA